MLVTSISTFPTILGKGIFPSVVNSLPNDKLLDLLKLKALADDKITERKIEISVGKCGKYCGKRRKSWLPAFSPFPTMFSKGFSLKGH